jgi:cell division protein FtsI (penicillin-binding protein 3)
VSPRADQPPRRGVEPRRGASRDLPAEQLDDDGRRGFGGIGDARAYTPRGRTVAERDQRTRSPRAGRNADPFRPALQVLDGGRPGGRRRGPVADDPEPSPSGTQEQRRGTQEQRRGTQEQRRGTDQARRASEPRRAQKRQRDEEELEVAAGRERASSRRSAPARPAERGTSSARRATAGGRLSGKGRTEAQGRTGRERKVAVAPAARRTAGGRSTKAVPPARPVSRRPAPAVPVEPPKLANSSRRLRLGTVVALALFATIGVRLVVLQVVESPAEAQSLLEQRQNRLTEVVLPAPRGSILDRSGAVLAHSVEARYIYADPELVKDAAGAAAKLSPLLGVAPSKLTQLMAKKKRPGGGASRFEYLARGVDIGVADKIVKMNLAGISEGRDERRDLPGADLAANLIGFTGEDHTGLEGLEARYDDLLRGTDGEKVYETGNPNVENGKLAKEIPGGYHRETPAQPGTSLELTIDRDLQFEVQRYLSDDMQRVNAVIGAAVVLDVQTGEVLAQASYPAYNAAKPFDAKPIDREDVASSVVADPGSTHKAFMLSAALQEGLITPDSTITVGPALSRGGYTFADTHPQKRGTKLTIPGVLAYSSNVGTIRIGDMLGPKRVYEYQQKFGLGEATGEGMPGEATGRILAPDEWSGSASGSVPIGMSVDATLIQMAAGYAAIANDGTYVQPHLIKSTIDSQGRVTPSPAPETHPVLSPNVARGLRTMMEAVVDVKGATGTQAAVRGYRVAGKTGTGKRLVDGQYTRYNAGSFLGMAPAENPRFVVAVFADVPNGTGGDVAAPAFSKMMSFALAHYRVPPSGTTPPKFKIYP